MIHELEEKGHWNKSKQWLTLVKKCVNLNSEDRPTMKEVTMELHGIRKFHKQPWTSTQSQEEVLEFIGLMFEKYSTYLYGIGVE